MDFFYVFYVSIGGLGIKMIFSLRKSIEVRDLTAKPIIFLKYYYFRM